MPRHLIEIWIFEEDVLLVAALRRRIGIELARIRQ